MTKVIRRALGRAATVREPMAAEGATAGQLTASERTALYSARGVIGTGLEKKFKIRIPFDVYFQDPLVAARNPALAFDEDCHVPWEPGISDGPTSARFAVVDYDAHTETLAAPARWDKTTDRFLDPAGRPLDSSNTAPPQFDQVNVWATLQRALDFFEGPAGLGRRVPWAFEGNRLIVVPHAGPGQNAYYDRHSKSLQFYYFDSGDERINTCLSSDIINHEFGHAVLDGIRPYYIEAVAPETAAFHEFVGDLTAILITLRNTAFRKQLIDETRGNLRTESTLSRLAEQFGRHVRDKPYLRSARTRLRMQQVADDHRPHYMSQVLTGAMFDIVIRLSQHYLETRKASVAEAFWHTIQRMQCMAIQPLDLLPVVDVTFRDYALAVLRAEEVADPADPDDYRGMMLDVFVRRGILDRSERAELRKPHHVFDRLSLSVFHSVHSIASSRADAYRFLDDNRDKLFIPPNVDVVVADVSTARKQTRQARRLPEQVLLQYVWREDVVLDGPQFGRFAGERTTMLCGGTLAVNEDGELLAWARKPGSQPTGHGHEALAERARGQARRAAFLDALARRIHAGRIGTALGSPLGLLGAGIPTLTAARVDGAVRFELAPHFGIHADERDVLGGRAWQISS